MSPAAVALLAMLASVQEAAPVAADNPRASVAQEVVTHPPPRAVTEVAQPAPASSDVPERPTTDPATGAPADPAPADPQPGEPAPPAPAEPAGPAPAGATPAVGVPAPPAPTASLPPVVPPLPSTSVTAGPGFSAGIDTPLDPINAAAAPVSEGGVRLSPVIWALLLALVLAGGAAVLNQRHRRLIERTRGMLSLLPSLDTGAPRPPGKLAFARPSTSISARLEPGATRWKD